MKKQLLFLSLVVVLLAGCSKTEPGTPGGGSDAAVEISAKAVGSGSIDTKAPVTGSTLDGKQADVYTTVSPLHTYMGDKTRMLTDAYARGTMTFDDAKYVGYDVAGFGGKDGGNALLPTDGSVRYLYAFYPAGWMRAADATNAFETLSFTFDGSHDVMTSWMTGDQDVQVKHKDATLPERGEFTFKHLLMRCDVQVQAKDANAIAQWGSVKSVKIKGAVNNKVTTDASLGYNYSTGGGAVSFFKMEGTNAARTYSDVAFEQAAFADMLPLKVDLQNACYSMLAPIDVTDNDPQTAELTLVVVTRDKADADGGKEVSTEVPISLDPAKFTDPRHSTRGYAVTIQLNFRAGAIKAIATVEEWKNGGTHGEDIDGDTPAPPKVGDLKDGGIIYEVNGLDYKVFSLKTEQKAWAKDSNLQKNVGATSTTDGRVNVAALKARSADTGNGGSNDFAVDFPAAAYCEGLGAGWYLPAQGELQAIYNLYYLDPGAWESKIINNGGTGFSRALHWSSTADGYIVDINFAGGSPDGGATNSEWVRCVKRSN